MIKAVADIINETDKAAHERYPDESIRIGKYSVDDSFPCYLSSDARSTHMQIVGAIKSGKTNFIELLVRGDILAGHSTVLFDPTGNLYKDVVRWIVDSGMLANDPERFILVDPNMSDFSFTYNPLYFDRDGLTQDEILNKTVDVVGVVKRALDAMMREVSGSMPTYSTTLRAVLYLLVEKQLTLTEALDLTVPRSTIQQFLTSHVEKKEIKTIWESFNRMKDTEYISTFTAVFNRLVSIMEKPAIKRMFGQQGKALDFVDVADTGKVVLVNLSATSSGMDPEAAEAIGRILINDMISAMRYRVRKNNKEPRPLNAFIDECDQYLCRDITDALDKKRQFGLRLHLAHQHSRQLEGLDKQIEGSVEESTNMKVILKIGRKTAEAYAPDVFTGSLDPRLINEVFLSPTVVGYNQEVFISRTEALGQGGAVSHTDATGRVESSMTGISSGISQLDTGLLGGSVAPVMSAGDSMGSGTAHSVASSRTETESWSRAVSETRSIQLVPELEWLPTQAISIEHQREELVSLLKNQPRGHCFLSPDTGATLPVAIDLVPKVVTTRDEDLDEALDKYALDSGFYVPSVLADKIIEERAALIEKGVLPGQERNDDGDNDEEPGFASF